MRIRRARPSSLWLSSLLAAAAVGCVSEPDYTGRRCSDLDPCPEGWVCRADRCEAPGAIEDGGSDAGTPDAGPRDVGPADVGASDAAGDAGPTDVTPPDLGPMDAGFPDAGDPRIERCNDPIDYPGQGWQVRYYTAPNLPDPSFGECLAVDDIAMSQLDQFFGIAEGPAMGVTDFGAIWTARRTFQAGVYTIVMDHDDGVRVYIDNELLHEDWDHGRELGVVFRTGYMSAGAHDIRIEHFDDDGEAVMRFSAERGCTRLEVPPTGWIVSYHHLSATDQIEVDECYGVETFTGAGIDVDHGLGAPPLVAAQGDDDDFAIIARTRRVMGGLTQFDALFDDGLRVFVDGTPVIDIWEDGTTRSRRSTAHFVGEKEIQVEKYDEADQSRLRLDFETVCNLPPASTAGIWFATYYPVTYVPSPESWTLNRADCIGAEVINTNGLDWDGTPAVPLAAGYSSLWGAEYFGNRTFGTSRTVAVRHDDGLRVYSSSSLFYEDWTAPLVRMSSFTLPPGNHNLRVEYFENQGGEQLHITW